MNSIPIKDAAGATRAIDTFVRDEDGTDVETQAIAVVNPTTGDPLRPTSAGAMPVEVASLPLPTGAATQATLAALNVIAQAISDAVAALNDELTGRPLGGCN